VAHFLPTSWKKNSCELRPSLRSGKVHTRTNTLGTKKFLLRTRFHAKIVVYSRLPVQQSPMFEFNHMNYDTGRKHLIFSNLRFSKPLRITRVIVLSSKQDCSRLLDCSTRNPDSLTRRIRNFSGNPLQKCRGNKLCLQLYSNLTTPILSIYELKIG